MKKDADRRWMRRLVLGPWWWLIARRNIARWWWQEYQRYQKSHWVLHWMTETYGPANCMMGERSWRIGGILCTIWLGPMRLKVYHNGGKACRHFDLTDPLDAARARDHVRHLPENRTLQEHLGHSHVETTEIYTHANGSQGVVSPMDRAPLAPVAWPNVHVFRATG